MASVTLCAILVTRSAGWRDGSQPPDQKPANGADHQEVKGVSQPLDLSELDDFQVIEERRKVMTALAFLTDKYRDLNEEMTRRETLRWMTA